MSEQVNESWEYDVAPAAVFRMLTRLDHLTEQAISLRYQRFAVRELREREGFFRVSAERLLSEGLRGRPVLVKYTQRWEPPAWDGTRRFETAATFGGSALTVSGLGELQPAGLRGTRFSMRLTLHSGARFFAQPVEREAAATLAEVLAGEHRFREQWLADRDTGSFRLTA